MLDVGTNNQKLLDDPRYMGWRHERITQQEYSEFIDLFIQALKRRWPRALLQFEDFAQPSATPFLERYRREICCFNDDIQGTAAVTAGTLLAACRVKGVTLSEQKVVFVGAGSAGCGIAEQVVRQMVAEGLDEQQARANIFMVDKEGLLTDEVTGLRGFQKQLRQKKSALKGWTYSGALPTLRDVINLAKPGVLIGVSGQPGLFTEPVIRAMAANCDRPIIFPLSNPSRQVEALPEQVITWTEGNVIIATGSPFKPVLYQEKRYPIAQCNNSYIFPGLGLGVLAAGIKHITDEMLMLASTILADESPLANHGQGELLPPLTQIAELSRKIAFGIGKLAQQQGEALEITDEQLHEKIEQTFWQPVYRQYKRVCV